MVLLLALAGAGAAFAAGPIFVERTAESGLDFHHFNGMSGRFYFAEVVGAGGGLLDFDGDGDLDLYLVQGRMLGPDSDIPKALIPPRHPLPLRDRLYRNDLTVAADGSRTVKWVDVTESSGIDGTGYGMGVATGDYDNDGRVDLYVTQFDAPNRLWRNEGGGTFSDATSAAGVGEERWSVPAVFFDFDRDGWLDLYVGNYMDYTLARNKACIGESGLRDYCGPQSYKPLPDRLFRNRRDGTFEDVSEKSGITADFGATLGVTAADFDGDGWLDVYVANDQTANQLWLNQRDGTFANDALLLGCALNRDGQAEASMGVDAADVDGDGDLDLFMTHLTRESNTLYLNDGSGLFRDLSTGSGLGNPSWGYTGFGTAFFDYDNDGWLDLYVANGSVYIIFELAREKDPYPLHQTNQLYRNLGLGENGRVTFAETTSEGGEVFEHSGVSRGALFGDLDNDGDTDVVVTNSSGPARVLINQVGNRAHWLGLRLVTGEPRRDALGARIAVHRPGRPPLWRRARADGSFASANDPRVLIGLGEGEAVSRLEVHWPDGTVEEWDEINAGAYLTLARGTGQAVEPRQQ
ncbi:MAG: CRTAC1 family protein [bacterium]|nr:CRTAC1 family protein [bacterium]